MSYLETYQKWLSSPALSAEEKAELEAIKAENKKAFAKFAKRQQGVVLNTDGIFDVQVKRQHVY